MSDNLNENSGLDDEDGVNDLKVDELAMLKSRAKMMGITFSNNISVETLREKIQAKMDGDAEGATKTPDAPVVDDASNAEQSVKPAASTAKEKKKTLRNFMIEENMKLVRIRVTNLDPKKKELHGEFFTIANDFLGTVTKFVPYGEATDNGYHVPYCIYKMLKNRKFLSIRTFKDRQNSNQIRIEQRWANEFALEVLPQLTPDELAKLAAAQTAGGNIG